VLVLGSVAVLPSRKEGPRTRRATPGLWNQ
jgi:hypothetical protein